MRRAALITIAAGASVAAIVLITRSGQHNPATTTPPPSTPEPVANDRTIVDDRGGLAHAPARAMDPSDIDETLRGALIDVLSTNDFEAALDITEVIIDGLGTHAEAEDAYLWLAYQWRVAAEYPGRSDEVRALATRAEWRLAEARITVYDANPELQRTDPRGYENALFAAEFLADLAGHPERSGEILMDIIENRRDSLPPEAIERAIGNAGGHIRSQDSVADTVAILDRTLEVAPPDLTTPEGAHRLVNSAILTRPVGEFVAPDERALNILADAWSNPDLQQSPNPKTYVGSHYAAVLRDLGNSLAAADIYFEVAETYTAHFADRAELWPSRIRNGEVDEYTAYPSLRMHAYLHAYWEAQRGGNIPLAAMAVEGLAKTAEDHPSTRRIANRILRKAQTPPAADSRTPETPPE